MDTAEELAVLENSKIYANKFPMLALEINDTGRLQRAIEHAKAKGGVLIISSKRYITSSNLRIKKGIKVF